MIILGFLYARYQNSVYRYSCLLDNVEGYICISQKTIKLTSGFSSVEFLVVKIKRKGVWSNVKDILKVQLLINSVNNSSVIFYGDTFLIESSPSRIIKRNSNKKSVSIYNYFVSNGVYYNHFLFFNEMKFLGSNPISSFIYFFEKLRFNLKEKAFAKISDVSSRVILSNLLFGKGDIIEHNLKNAYVSTGLIHILAISGLHIGLIFFIVSFLLSKIVKNRSIVDVILLVIIWFYGFLILMPVPALRAILMITFYKINDLLYRSQPKYTFIFNSLMCSLIINPNWIYSIGFQLSYLATFGILFMANDVYNFFVLKSEFLWKCSSGFLNLSHIFLKIPKIILSSIAASVSVQLFIFPIILHNFQYFNFLSIFANIPIALFMSVIVFLGIILILSSFIPLVNTVISVIVEYCIYFLNTFVLRVSRVEVLKISVNSFSFNMVLAYYVALFICIFIIHYFKMLVIERKRILITNTLREIFVHDIQNEFSIFNKSIITVTNTFLLDGGKLMKVYFTVYSYEGEQLDSRRFLSFLNKIKGKIRYKLGLRLSDKLKFIPDILFYIDDTRDVSSNVNNLLNRINI